MITAIDIKYDNQEDVDEAYKRLFERYAKK